MEPMVESSDVSMKILVLGQFGNKYSYFQVEFNVESMFADLNRARVANGRPPIRFADPIPVAIGFTVDHQVSQADMVATCLALNGFISEFDTDF